MLTLHAQPLQGQDFVICETKKMPRHSSFDLKLQIDNGSVLKAGKIEFLTAYAPSVSEFYPGASAAATPRNEWDYDGEFYTNWFDEDDNSDGVEDESFIKHFTADRTQFQYCPAPIGIEVRDMEKLRTYENSMAENIDGLPSAEYINPEQGFKCNNTMQSLPGITCPNTQVRYRCLPNVQMFKGRIFTQVHGRMDHEDFHINRIHEQPKIVDETDGFKSEAVMFLNDGVNCGEHPNCGKNSRLTLKTVSGNNGILAYKPKAAIPGAYNFTYETLHQGRSLVKKRYFNFLNEESFPTDFEVFPSIKSITPQLGPVEGGTLITIDGTGFLEDGLGGAVTVAVGETDCSIKFITETQIICETVANTDTRSTSFAQTRMNKFLITTNKMPTNAAKAVLALNPDGCKAACARDHSCVAFVSTPECHIYDFVMSYEESTFSTSFLTRSEVETTCFTGRGSLYRGPLAITKNGHACVVGTFCRNTNLDEFARPNCVQEFNNKRVECNVMPCGDIKQYAGNRGVKTQTYFQQYFADDLFNHATPAYFDKSFISPAFHISASRDNFFYGQDGGADFYLAKSEAYFIAPMDGYYTFNLMADENAEMAYDHQNGVYSEINTYSLLNPNVLDSGIGVISEKKQMFKGEKMLIETILAEAENDDFLTIGVVYHGKDSSGTWHDHRDVIEYGDMDTYVYHHQTIDVLQDASDREHVIRIMIEHYRSDLEARTGFSAGQFWDKTRAVNFKLKQCGDNDNCFETMSIDPISMKRDDVEDHIKNNWLSTECLVAGTMKPEIYHANFESGDEGTYGQRNDQGAYCGRFAWRVLGDKIWDYNWNGEYLNSRSVRFFVLTSAIFDSTVYNVQLSARTKQTFTKKS